MATITLRYFASARAAAGVGEETVDSPSPAAAFRVSARRHGPQMTRVLAVSSFRLDGRSLARSATADPVTGTVTVDVLPPVSA